MSSTTRYRRTLSLLACTGLAAAAATFPAGPASAAPIVGQLQVAGNVSFSSSSPTCTEVGTEPSSSHAFSGGGASDSQSMDVTVTNTDAVTPDPGDHTRVTGSLSAATHVSQKNGSMTSYKLTGSGHVSINAAEGAASQCGVTASMTAQSMFLFSEAKSGWLYVTRSQGKNMVSEMAVVSPTGATPYIDLFGGPKSRNTERVFLKPGQYEGVNAVVVTGGGFLFFKAATQSAVLTGAFHVAGSALGATKGTGGKYVTFPRSVSCSQHTAKLTWSSKAGQVRSSTFFVNGSAKTSVRHPSAGGHVVLKHLSATKDAKVLVKLNLKGGGTASATRTYVACKG